MPDIDFQRIELNLIPKKGDEPVIFYASQYETTRPFIADLMWGETAFAPGDDCWAEIDIRKNDDNLVVITDDVAIDNNEVSVILPVQALTCIGKNLGQVKIYAGEDQLIAALNFILEVQPDPLAGGVTSETAIDNLTEQIEEITQQVIGDDYYNKTEVDGLLEGKADQATTYTKSEVDTALNLKADKATTYTKSQVDSALALKADASNVYTKSQTDTLLNAKANTADLATVATTGDYDDLLNKPTIPTKTSDLTNDSGYITETAIDDILPIVSVSGEIVTFNVALEKKLKTINVDNAATIVTACGVNLWDEETEVGSIDYSTGEKIPSTTNIRTKNYIPVKPNKGLYFINASQTGNPRIYFYDENKTFISARAPSTYYDSFTTPANCFYIMFYMTTAYGTTYNNDISVNYPSTDTSYHAYNGETYPVADINEITTLNGVNNIFADVGDVSVQAYDSIQHYIDQRT